MSTLMPCDACRKILNEMRKCARTNPIVPCLTVNVDPKCLGPIALKAGVAHKPGSPSLGEAVSDLIEGLLTPGEKPFDFDDILTAILVDCETAALKKVDKMCLPQTPKPTKPCKNFSIPVA